MLFCRIEFIAVGLLFPSADCTCLVKFLRSFLKDADAILWVMYCESQYLILEISSIKKLSSLASVQRPVNHCSENKKSACMFRSLNAEGICCTGARVITMLQVSAPRQCKVSESWLLTSVVFGLRSAWVHSEEMQSLQLDPYGLAYAPSKLCWLQYHPCICSHLAGGRSPQLAVPLW